MSAPVYQLKTSMTASFLIGLSISSASAALTTNDFQYIFDYQASDYTAQGMPLNTYDMSSTLPSYLLDRLGNILPSGVSVNDEVLQPHHDTNIHIDHDLGSAPYATMSISFLNEGALYRNTLGYFVYDAANPPQTIDDINEHVVIFPNASKHPIGDLTAGTTVDLDIQLQPGDSVGFFIIPNGWGWLGQYNTIESLGEWNQPFYSIPALNPEPLQANKQHNLIFADVENELLVVGFEDLLRKTGHDQDFNDLVFSVKVQPFTAISGMHTDGSSDLSYTMLPDVNSPTYNSTSIYPSASGYATLAFEDNWPTLGDYDFNDVVMQYRVQETLNPNRKLIGIDINYTLKSMGAGYHNGFALNLPSVTADQIASATVHLNGVEVGHTVIHDDGNQTILTIEPDLSDKLTQEGLIDQVCPYYRTEADCLASQPENGMEYSLSVTFNTPINRTDIGYPPYDPFIFSADHIYHGDYYPTPPGMGWQTHLKQFSGTSEFDSSLFGNYEDGSAGANFFVSGNAMPWAINITDVWDHPSEYKDISTAYPMFASWVTSSGRLNSDWYKSSRANAQFVYPYAQEN